VIYTAPTGTTLAGTSREFRGELGLCTHDPDNWSVGKPSEKCLQLVSACLLARVNALHRRVPISLRDSERILQMRKQVTVETKYRESDPDEGLSKGTPICSFTGDLRSPNCAARSDYGWQQAFTGRCAPGTTVQLQSRGECSASIRICSGIYGCEERNQGVPLQALAYTGFVPSSVAPPGGGCTVTFTCPAPGLQSAQVSTVPSSYAVMIKPLDGRSSALALAGKTARYPAPESEIFPFREAGFYGNLFEPEALSRTVSVKGDNLVIAEAGRVSSVPLPKHQSAGKLSIPYTHVYVCYGFEDQRSTSVDIQLTKAHGIANLNDRVCAGPGSNCFPNLPVACSNVCQWNDHEGVYEKCQGRDRLYPAITSYLDEPCSLVSAGQCVSLRKQRSNNRLLENQLPDCRKGRTNHGK
jgi:hypothetical protein